MDDCKIGNTYKTRFNLRRLNGKALALKNGPVKKANS